MYNNDVFISCKHKITVLIKTVVLPRHSNAVVSLRCASHTTEAQVNLASVPTRTLAGGSTYVKSTLGAPAMQMTVTGHMTSLSPTLWDR